MTQRNYPFRCEVYGPGPNDFRLVLKSVETRDEFGKYLTAPITTRTRDVDAVSGTFVLDNGTPIQLMDGRRVYACGPIIVSERLPAAFSVGNAGPGGPRATNDRSHVTPNDFGRVVRPSEINEQNRKLREQRRRETTEWDGPDAA